MRLFTKEGGVSTFLPVLTWCLCLLEVQNIDGQEVSLNDYNGKVVLIVNVASKWGRLWILWIGNWRVHSYVSTCPDACTVTPERSDKVKLRWVVQDFQSLCFNVGLSNSGTKRGCTSQSQHLCCTPKQLVVPSCPHWGVNFTRNTSPVALRWIWLNAEIFHNYPSLAFVYPWLCGTFVVFHRNTPVLQSRAKLQSHKLRQIGQESFPFQLSSNARKESIQSSSKTLNQPFESQSHRNQLTVGQKPLKHDEIWWVFKGCSCPVSVGAGLPMQSVWWTRARYKCWSKGQVLHRIPRLDKYVASISWRIKYLRQSSI